MLQRFEGFSSSKDAELLVDDVAGQDHGIMDDGCVSISLSDDSIVSSSTLDFSEEDDDDDDAMSSSSSLTMDSSPEGASSGPLYELSQLMVTLPIK